MEITKEVIQEVFNTNEELRGTILETVQNSEQGKQILDNYAKNYFEQAVKPVVGELHQKYDKDFEEITGLKKPDGVKSYEFWKNEFKGLADKAKGLDPAALEALKKENEQLIYKLENNEQAKHFKDLYESTKTTYQKQLEERENIINSFNEEKRTFKIKSELSNGLAKFELNSDLPEDVKRTYIETVFSGLMNGAKISDDGTVTFYDGETLIINPKTMAKATAEEILASKLKSIILQKGDAAGGGGQKGNTSSSKGVTPFTAAKTKTELYSIIDEKLLADGMIKGSKEFVAKKDELFSEFSSGLPLR